MWIVGEPGGPSGPFYSIVSDTGEVIAMQIPSRENAKLIVQLEAKLTEARKRVHELEIALETANNRIADLEEIAALEKEMLQAARELVQVDEDEDLFDPVNQAVISTMYSGTAFLLDCIEEPIHLPAGYYIAKAQPAA